MSTASQMRPETALGLRLLGAGVVVGVVHVAWRAGGPFTEAGRGGVFDLVACGFLGAVLWSMLAIRALAADGSVQDAIDDGLIATGVAVWVVALSPPRLSNYLPAGATSDFAYAYLPASLLGVLLVQAAVALWPGRNRTLVRLLGPTALSLLVLGALLRVVGGGDDAGQAALRAWAAAGIVAAVTAVVAWRARARGG